MTRLPIRPALVLLLLGTGVLGLAYPLAVTGLGHLLFPRQVAGSLVERHGRVVGSMLIGQSFSQPGYFWGRPSATTPQPYNGLASGGSNLGPLNPALLDAVRSNLHRLRDTTPGPSGPVPVDLVEASASGLDPEISLAAARFQVPRVAAARGIAPDRIEALVARLAAPRVLGFLGEPRVNVLALNLALDDADTRP